ncbi:MAG TPA: hypothetical protein P5531_14190 [Bacteroidales bacterium]|nr:hypothetical protein [Bacteroidales bacterium]HSA44702.1 hypothetical protein [Bacteroidales bacterium]
MKIKELEKQIEEILSEIETDNKELDNVPPRFRKVVEDELKSKQDKVSELHSRIDDLIQIGIVDRLQEPLNSFQEMVNSFINDYSFEYPQDKEMFINQIYFEENDDELLVNIKPKENATNHTNIYNKTLLKVIIDNNKIIHKPKSTDTFIEAIKELSLEKIKKLNLVFLGVPLIADFKHERYQQKQLSEKTFILTQISKEKKKEILEFIAKKFNQRIEVEFVK